MLRRGTPVHTEHPVAAAPQLKPTVCFVMFCSFRRLPAYIYVGQGIGVRISEICSEICYKTVKYAVKYGVATVKYAVKYVEYAVKYVGVRNIL
jgi:hypothetical protein